MFPTKIKKLISAKPLLWTEHAKFKMRQYGLSEARVKRVLRHPVRTEAGIAPKTVAVMQPAHPVLGDRPAFSSAEHTSTSLRFSGTQKSAGGFRGIKNKKSTKSEIWVMYADTKKTRKIIAAWRYLGVSPVREPPPFPEDLMGE